MPNTGAPNTRAMVRVVKPEVIAEFVLKVSASHHKQTEAAAVLGVHQSAFSRLARPHTVPKRMRLRTIERLEELILKARNIPNELKSDARRRLWSSVIGPEVNSRLAKYKRWLFTELSRFDLYIATTQVRPVDPPDPEWLVGLRSLPLLGDSASPWPVMTRAICETHSELRKKEPCRRLLDKFVEDTEKLGHGSLLSGRVLLSIARVVAPLIPDGGGIEVSWRGLNDKSLTQYLKRALDSERLLLQRLPDLQRAQEVASL